MNLNRKGSSALTKVGKSISITNKLLRETENREIAPSDDFRVSIPDLNFQKYLIEKYILEIIDGTVAYRDVKGISILEVHEEAINSLDGVQYFSDLTVLNCNSNQLTSLDVSKNTALIRLFCMDNQLTSLDVSNNIKLEHLSCHYNQLTSLDVSQNFNLQTLYCTNNLLKSIDVTNNKFLQELCCGVNQIISLDLSKNTILKELQCENNQLFRLEFSYNPNLQKVKLNGNPGNWWKELEKKWKWEK